MDSTNDTNETRTDDSITILVLATGLVKAERYVKDYGAVAARAVNGIAGLEAMLGGSANHVLTRGSPELQEELDAELDADVESAFFGWIGFLNDEAETDNAGNEVVPAVREADEIEVDTNPDDASSLPWDDIDESRIQRAKAKAGAKMNHFLFDSYYDKFADVDAVILLNCGSHRGLNEIRDARGCNDWVSGQAGHVKQTLDINVQDEVLYARRLLDGNSMTTADLHESQVEELRAHLTEDELAAYGIDIASTTPNGGGVASAD